MEEKKQDQLTALYEVIFTESLNGYSLQPKLGKSREYKFRNAVVDEKICKPCWDKYGTVFPNKKAPTTMEIRLNSHHFCRCFIEPMLCILSGTATVYGNGGADYSVKLTGSLPDNYIKKEEAKEKGWKEWVGNLHDVLPGASIYTTYQNRKKKLPESQDRVWYEADINYHSGHRNSQRLLFSDDGLIFVTYDHYQTFFQIV
jgi:ribonuclease